MTESDHRGKLFGTDGIRGIANMEPMTVETCVRLGRSAAHVFKDGTHRHRILIGKDTRLSGYMLENALVAGICSMGVDVIQVGPMPTPGMAFLAQDMRCHAGVMISASHNPFQDNGIKIFTRDGRKADREFKVRLTELTAGDTRTLPVSEVATLEPRGLLEQYLAHTCQILEGVCLPAGFSLAIDCANGANSGVAPVALRRLGLDLHVIHDSPDGRNINLHCGSTHPEALAQVVVDKQCDLGAAFDGDGDRVVFVDHQEFVLA